MPILERSYGALIAELAEHLRQNDHGSLENDFVLGEFLDRYGMRLQPARHDPQPGGVPGGGVQHPAKAAKRRVKEHVRTAPDFFVGQASSVTP